MLCKWNGPAPRKDRQKGKWGDITPKTVSHNHKRENRRAVGLMVDITVVKKWNGSAPRKDRHRGKKHIPTCSV